MERERQHVQAQRTAELGWWEWDLFTGRLTWSEEHYRLWRWPAEEPVTTTAVITTFHPDDRQRVLEESAKLRMGGKPYALDFRAVRRDGVMRWFRGSGHIVSNQVGTAVRLFGTVQDVTDQRRVAGELRATQRLWERLAGTTPDGIATISATGRITFVNARLARLLGYGVQELIGTAAAGLLGRGSRALPAGGTQPRLWRLESKDGAQVHVLASVSPLLDDDGEHAGSLLVVSDLATRREADEKLRRPSVPGRTRHGDIAPVFPMGLYRRTGADEGG